jgi:hypothetical protein
MEFAKLSPTSSVLAARRSLDRVRSSESPEQSRRDDFRSPAAMCAYQIVFTVFTTNHLCFTRKQRPLVDLCFEIEENHKMHTFWEWRKVNTRQLHFRFDRDNFGRASRVERKVTKMVPQRLDA